MEISVALATCEGERFLEEQLESIARQTVQPAEVVACDDASTDGTVAILESFARDAAFPVRIERNETRLGVGDNFIKAARLCGHPIVAFSDQDDVWLEQKLARCAGALADPGVRLVIHACDVVHERLERTGAVVPRLKRSEVAPPRSTHKWLEAPGMAMVFDRELLRVLQWEHRPSAHHSHGRLLHDEWVYGVARVAGKIAFLADPLALYRQHAVNVEGAPERGARPTARLVTTVGGAYYARRAEQARGWAALLDAEPDLDGARAEAASYARLAGALEARAHVYESERRLGALASAIRGGAYRPRSREGFGLRGFVRDVVLTVLRRGG